MKLNKIIIILVIICTVAFSNFSISDNAFSDKEEIGTLESMQLHSTWPYTLTSAWLETDETGQWKNYTAREFGKTIDDFSQVNWYGHTTTDNAAVTTDLTNIGYVRDSLEIRYIFTDSTSNDLVYITNDLDENLSLNGFKNIVYYVKADLAGKLKTRIRLHTNDSYCEVPYTKIDSNEWKKIEFKISDFSKECNLDNIDMIRIGFNDVDNDFSNTGMILLDELYLTNHEIREANFTFRNPWLKSGSNVSWRIHAKDSFGNIYSSQIKSFVVGENIPPIIEATANQGILNVNITEDNPYRTWYNLFSNEFTICREETECSKEIKPYFFADDFEEYSINSDAYPTWTWVSKGPYRASWIKEFQGNKVLLLDDSHYVVSKKEWFDFTAEVDYYIATLGYQPWHGVRLDFRATEGSRTKKYYLQINPNANRARLSYRTDMDTYSHLATKTNFPTSIKEWHNLKVKTEGCKIYSYLDNELIIWDDGGSYVDSCSKLSGSIGLTSEGTGTATYFNDLKVYSNEAKLDDGKYALTIYSMDKSGNTASKKINFTIGKTQQAKETPPIVVQNETKEPVVKTNTSKPIITNETNITPAIMNEPTIYEEETSKEESLDLFIIVAIVGVVLLIAITILYFFDHMR